MRIALLLLATSFLMTLTASLPVLGQRPGGDQRSQGVEQETSLEQRVEAIRHNAGGSFAGSPSYVGASARDLGGSFAGAGLLSGKTGPAAGGSRCGTASWSDHGFRRGDIWSSI